MLFRSVAEEPEFKELMAKVKGVKALYRERVEAEQLRNLERKNAIISELMSMADDTVISTHVARI